MRALINIPHDTNFHFIERRRMALVVSAVLLLVSVVAYGVRGLNYGIDFAGGILLEVKTEGPADLGALRDTVDGLNLGDVTLQTFGAPDIVLLRVKRQAGGKEAQAQAIRDIKAALPDNVTYRRTEYVGPVVGEELIQAGVTAVVLAMLAIMVYIWFRFEWQFGLGAVVALVHDVITTVGLFALLQMQFNLSTVAAILTIAGYSINDTVVVYDRVREDLRRYKTTPLKDVFNMAINHVLGRTVMTSVTTLLALLALYFFGGEVIEPFTIAMIWGVIVGTYSSSFVAVPFLLYLNFQRGSMQGDTDADEATQNAGA